MAFLGCKSLNFWVKHLKFCMQVPKCKKKLTCKISCQETVSVTFLPKNLKNEFLAFFFLGCFKELIIEATWVKLAHKVISDGKSFLGNFSLQFNFPVSALNSSNLWLSSWNFTYKFSSYGKISMHNFGL